MIGHCDGEFIDASRADGGSRFRAQEESLRQLFDIVLILVHPVVESRHIHDLCESRLECRLRPIHALCDRTRGVETVTDVLQVSGYLPTLLAPLLRNLIADAPHHDRRMIAVAEDQILDIPVVPLLEEPCISILAFRINPHIKAFGHDHHSHRVAYLHLPCRRHIMSRTDGVASHVLHYAQLSYERSLVDRCAQRSKVVVQAHPFYFTGHPIELEPILFTDGDCPYAHFRLVGVD